ncbi:MAG: hypothetical protein JWP96_1368 [Polaromonas sp.]|nr:hypothetical protein [Polaromonas sp.]
MTIQNPADTFLDANALRAEFSDLEEAARYALLQRLAPSLEHHLMGKFQSMGMIAAMMERRFQSDVPDLDSLREDCSSLGSVSSTAVSSLINIMAWIEPKTDATMRFDAGVSECLGLLSTKLRFKGFVIVNEVPQIDVELSSRALRSVLSSALIALSDLSKLPATLVIRAIAMPDCVELSIGMQPIERKSKSAYVSNYRALKWRDVEVLAMAESVKLKLDETGAQLSFMRAVANPDL